MSAADQRVPYSVAARELLRNTLLDAACHELQGNRWSEITMADIAMAAGVSRQTLYKEFGSREEFAQVLVLREAERFLDAVEQAVSANVAAPVKALTAAFELFLNTAAENPVVRAVVIEEGAEELLSLLTTQGKPLVERAAERLTAVIVASWPPIRPRDAQLLSDVLVRLAISYAALPNGDPAATAASITRLLEPYVERLVAAGIS
jgi:AcrR family transcriptional regulator